LLRAWESLGFASFTLSPLSSWRHSEPAAGDWTRWRHWVLLILDPLAHAKGDLHPDDRRALALQLSMHTQPLKTLLLSCKPPDPTNNELLELLHLNRLTPDFSIRLRPAGQELTDDDRCELLARVHQFDEPQKAELARLVSECSAQDRRWDPNGNQLADIENAFAEARARIVAERVAAVEASGCWDRVAPDCQHLSNAQQRQLIACYYACRVFVGHDNTSRIAQTMRWIYALFGKQARIVKDYTWQGTQTMCRYYRHFARLGGSAETLRAEPRQRANLSQDDAPRERKRPAQYLSHQVPAMKPAAAEAGSGSTESVDCTDPLEENFLD